MNFKKEYSLTYGDYLRFNLRNVKRQAIIYGALVIVLAFLIRLYAADMDTSVLKTVDFWLMYILFVFIGVFVVVAYLFLIVYFTSKMVYKNNKAMYENLSFEFSEEGIHQCVGEHKMVTKWDEFSKNFVVFGIYCFMISDRQGIIIPKRVFSEEEKNWLNSKLK